MSFEWSELVSRVVDGVTRFCGNDINPIIDALDKRTLYLKNHLNNLENSNCGLVFSDCGFSPEVVAKGRGSILAWDGSQYILASAKFDTNFRDNGSMAPADSSYVIGILITDIDSLGYGTILAHGWTSDAELISIVTNGHSLREPEPRTGAYYLADNGTAVCGEAVDFNLPVYCFTYTGTDKLIVNPRVPEFTGHSHGKFLFDPAKWAQIAEADLPDTVKEHIGNSGTTFYVYKASDDSTGTLARLLQPCVPDKAVLTNDGVAMNYDDWYFTDTAVYVAFSVSISREIVLYTIAPLIGVEPMVHSIVFAEGGRLFSVTNSDGNVAVTFNDTCTPLDSYTGIAVGSITNNNGVQSVPVVHTLGAGAGIDITQAEDDAGNGVPGVYVIHSSDRSRNQIDMNVCNLDGVLFGVDKLRVSYKFPSGVTSSLYGTFRIPHFSGVAKYVGKLNVIVQGSGNSIEAATATLTPVHMPTSEEPSNAIIGQAFTLDSISSTQEQKYYLVSAELGGGICVSDALVHCKLTFDRPAQAVTVLGMSIQLIG